MPYFPISTTTDDRSAQGAAPVQLRNLRIEPAQEDGGQGPYVVTTPGLRRVVGFDNPIRGLFARAGVENGDLFIVTGQQVVRRTATGVQTTMTNTIPGTDPVRIDALEQELVFQAGGPLYTIDGTALTAITDEDAPADAAAMAVVAGRVVASARGSDQIDWSAPLNVTDWPASGFGQSGLQPDSIVALAAVQGDLWVMGEATVQPFRALGGEDADAFDTIDGVVIERGLIGPHAWSKVDGTILWVGDDRVVYAAEGFEPRRVINRALEARLKPLSAAQVSALQAFPLLDGSRLDWVLRLPDGPAYCYDVGAGRWHERSTFGREAWRPTHQARIGSQVYLAGPDDNALYALDPATYTDDGELIERVAVVYVPFAGRAPIYSITLHIRAFGHSPGIVPRAMVSLSQTGQEIDSLVFGQERQIEIGADSTCTAWRLGMAGSRAGLWVKIRVTDATGFALYGLWLNEPRPK